MKPGHVAFRHEGVLLRPIVRSDLETMRRWRNQDDVRRWFKSSAIVSAEEQARWFDAYSAKADDFMWIAETADRRGGALGQAALYGIDRAAGAAEIGRFIAAPEFRGSGHFGPVCRAMIHHAFDDLHLTRLTLEVFAANEAARRLYGRCGFHITGRSDGLVGMALDAASWSPAGAAEPEGRRGP